MVLWVVIFLYSGDIHTNIVCKIRSFVMDDFNVCFMNNPMRYVIKCGTDIISMTPAQWQRYCVGIVYEDVGIKYDHTATYLVSCYQYGGVHLCIKHRFTPSVFKRVLNNKLVLNAISNKERMFYPYCGHVGYQYTSKGDNGFVFFTHDTCENKNTAYIPYPNLGNILIETKHPKVIRTFKNVKRYISVTHILGKRIVELLLQLNKSNK